MKDIVTEHDNTNIPSDIYSIRYIVPMFIPYAGVPTYSIEYVLLLKTVVLNDLRNLYKKTLKFETDYWDLNKLEALEKLEKVSPEHYDNIFKKDNPNYNVDLIKELYTDDYEFLTNTKINEITIEEFKQRYVRIIDQLNSYVGRLASRRELINSYLSARETNDEEKLALYRPIIERYENEITNYMNKNKKNKVDASKNKTKDEFQNFSSPKNKPIKLIKCLINRKKFIDAFMRLLEEEYVSLIEFDDLHDLESKIGRHFKFNEDHERICEESFANFPKIRWTKKPRVLVYFIQQLKLHRVIEVMPNKITNLIISHFSDEYGNNYTTKQISDATNKTKNNKGAKTENIKGVPTGSEDVTAFIGYLELS